MERITLNEDLFIDAGGNCGEALIYIKNNSKLVLNEKLRRMLRFLAEENGCPEKVFLPPYAQNNFPTTPPALEAEEGDGVPEEYTPEAFSQDELMEIKGDF